MYVRLSLVLFAMLPARVETVAADHSAVLPLVTDDVVAIAYLDLQAVNLSAVLQEARNWGCITPEEQGEAAAVAVTIQDWLGQLIDHGAIVAYALLRVSDVPHGGPTWVLSLTDDARPDTLCGLLKAVPGGGGATHCRHVNGVLLAAMNESQIESLLTVQSKTHRVDAATALDELGAGAAGLIVIGNADSRRVLREMFPRLPAPFDHIDGRLIADDLLWGGVVLDLPPQPKATIHIQTSDVEVANKLHQTAVTGLETAKQMAIAQLTGAAPKLPPAEIQQTLGMFQPTVKGTAVTLTFGDDAEQLAAVGRLLSVPIAAAREKAATNSRINQFRQLALAALNYESANGTLPQQASYDDTGRPLLSWRVHVLPFLAEMALYREFHLDEPWDSPHNRTLIARMPATYADPSATVRRAVGDAGRTTFVAPAAAETVFPPRRLLPDGAPLTLKDLADGSSKTIMFVEVVPERAVIWTKPEDWDVDLNHALNGVQRADRPFFTAVFCDGHLQLMDNKTTAQQIRGMLTRSGGD